MTGSLLDINERFRKGRPSNSLDEVGLLIHQWDGLEAHDKGKPWQMCITNCMCQGQFINGRISAMAVYSGLKSRSDRIAISLPFGNRGGILLHPSHAQLDCLYGMDGATYHLDDPRHPGCTDNFCDPTNAFIQNGYCGLTGYPPQAWAPKDLEYALTLHAEHGSRYSSPGFHSGCELAAEHNPSLRAVSSSKWVRLLVAQTMS
jgi:hypothetical protein